MKVFMQIISAVVFVALCLKLTVYTESIPQPSLNDLRLATTSYGVIEDNFSAYKTPVVSVAEAEEPEPEMNKHLDKYSDEYLGAIEIPAINTSEPIYSGKGEYYLTHNFEKKANDIGEVYLDDRTGTSITGNGALYNGHAVPNGKKFGNFKKLLNEKEQPKVYIYDHAEEKVVTYKMLFVSLIDAENSGIVMNFESEEQEVQYYKNLYITAIKQWEEPSSKDSVILLNSCSYIIQDGRYIVVAKKEG